MNTLTPQEYDLLERDNKIRLTNWIIRLGAPIGFDSIAFPTRISSLQELHRYSDTMHETRTKRYFERMGGLSSQELQIVKEIKKARDSIIAKTNAPVRSYSLAPILSAIFIGRAIEARIQNPSKHTIFEVAAGSGYLACVLALKGFRVITTDATQAFYLFQNHLYSTLFGNDFIELAHNKENKEFDGGKIIHIPWWQFYTLHEAKTIPFISIFTCNHALAEMDSQVRNYVISLAKNLLTSGDDVGEFIIEGWGGK